MSDLGPRGHPGSNHMMSSDSAGGQITGVDGRVGSDHYYADVLGNDDRVDPAGATYDEIGTNNRFADVRQNNPIRPISENSDYENSSVKQVNNYEELLPAASLDEKTQKPVYESLIRKS